MEPLFIPVGSTQIASLTDMKIHTDPVCGTKVDELAAVGQSEYLGRRYYFCSESCKRKFDQRPEDYIVRTGRARQVSEDGEA
jgi:YHS domain-containing protein